jgi:hypothetical protein
MKRRKSRVAGRVTAPANGKAEIHLFRSRYSKKMNGLFSDTPRRKTGGPNLRCTDRGCAYGA